MGKSGKSTTVGASSAPETTLDKSKARRFYAIRKLHRNGDHHPPYQIEMVLIKDGLVLEQRFIGKPDTLSMANGSLQTILDPINALEDEDETNSVLA